MDCAKIKSQRKTNGKGEIMGKRFEYLAAPYYEEAYDEILDNESEKSYSEFDEICNLLNEQDEKIKRFEEALTEDAETLTNSFTHIQKLEKENKQLKQSQNSKAIEVLEDVKNRLRNLKYITVGDFDDLWATYKYIDNQITELRGGENE